MGTYYSDSLTSGGTRHYGAVPFYESLGSCLRTAVGAVKQLSFLKLKVDHAPDSENKKDRVWSQDSLLVYRGSPLLAVAIMDTLGFSANTYSNAPPKAHPRQIWALPP